MLLRIGYAFSEECSPVATSPTLHDMQAQTIYWSSVSDTCCGLLDILPARYWSRWYRTAETSRPCGMIFIFIWDIIRLNWLKHFSKAVCCTEFHDKCSCPLVSNPQTSCTTGRHVTASPLWFGWRKCRNLFLEVDMLFSAPTHNGWLGWVGFVGWPVMNGLRQSSFVCPD